MVVETFHILGPFNDQGVVEDTFVFSAHVRQKITSFVVKGQLLLGYVALKSEPRLQPLVKSISNTHLLRLCNRDFALAGAVSKEFKQLMTEEQRRTIQPIGCAFFRDSEVGDLGTFAARSTTFFFNGTRRVNMKVGSIGKTVEAEPAVPRLPQQNVELREICNRQEEMRRDMIKRLESSVEVALKGLSHEGFDALGGRLHEKARLADNAEAPAQAAQYMEAPLAAALGTHELTTLAPEAVGPSRAEGGMRFFNDSNSKAKHKQADDLPKGVGPPAKVQRTKDC